MTPPDAPADAGTAGAPPGPVDCEAVVRRLWDYLDGRLPAVTRDEVDAHLAACRDCPPHFAFAGAMRRALAASAEPPAGDDAGDDADARLRDRVRRALRR